MGQPVIEPVNWWIAWPLPHPGSRLKGACDLLIGAAYVSKAVAKQGRGREATMRRKEVWVVLVSTFFLVMMVFALASEEQILGRWDVTVQGAHGNYPSWFEISQDNGQLKGRFVGRVGSARPIAKVSISGGELKFSLPIQYESHKSDLTFAGKLVGGKLEGATNAEDGSTLKWTAVRAPDLKVSGPPQWGKSIQLFNGKDVSGWKARDPKAPNNWKAENGVLVNTAKGTDLITEQTFKNYKLHLEFQYPEKSNSGIYLRGRYEVQIQDDIGKPPSSVFIGGVYGFVTPTTNAGQKAGEWQTYDITLMGRTITVVLNGQTVIENQEIPGITGGALDSNEGEPGPIMLQGDHGPVSFRNVVLTPAREA